MNAQLELFSADGVFINSPVDSVVGHVQPRLLFRREVWREAVVAYHQVIESQHAVDINHIDAYADTRASGLICPMVNWQARSTPPI